MLKNQAIYIGVAIAQLSKLLYSFFFFFDKQGCLDLLEYLIVVHAILPSHRHQVFTRRNLISRGGKVSPSPFVRPNPPTLIKSIPTQLIGLNGH